MDDDLKITTPEQFKALGHPLRQRLMFALGEPATMAQLAARLGAQKGNVAHHLKVLREAGMVRVIATKQVRGGTEQYYQRSARRIDLEPRSIGSTSALLGAVAEEIAGAADDPLLTLRHVRLTAAQAAKLRAALAELAENIEPAGPEEARYGLLVSMYQEGISS
ncbi:ArsR/SmtB family transcription factor [Longispora albida]|uniref:ArsR/SmtB family transcription factor n=1 Tax=Longispora albida TaxID=203523 RepID=UPI000365F4ED|nr:helix-turn-helix domain-containing protein [Longispora albida]